MPIATVPVLVAMKMCWFGCCLDGVLSGSLVGTGGLVVGGGMWSALASWSIAEGVRSRIAGVVGYLIAVGSFAATKFKEEVFMARTFYVSL
ncbi:hypothetical protein BP00DRAFT_115817 [Aspergillus indologenus CBS 114.80]|uniref:Uncharacterized protein n=1 Tax=Aspergillus indologenus CBS 114.80 TaxID=1450541 RepID=A0A2V5IN06_9EURO|nr:hypothetical protein BP00DRAFT_115817 [Aspergillus indologenus CBS 114.80]